MKREVLIMAGIVAILCLWLTVWPALPGATEAERITACIEAGRVLVPEHACVAGVYACESWWQVAWWAPRWHLHRQVYGDYFEIWADDEAEERCVDLTAPEKARIRVALQRWADGRELDHWTRVWIDGAFPGRAER